MRVSLLSVRASACGRPRPLPWCQCEIVYRISNHDLGQHQRTLHVQPCIALPSLTSIEMTLKLQSLERLRRYRARLSSRDCTSSMRSSRSTDARCAEASSRSTLPEAAASAHPPHVFADKLGVRPSSQSSLTGAWNSLWHSRRWSHLWIFSNRCYSHLSNKCFTCGPSQTQVHLVIS